MAFIEEWSFYYTKRKYFEVGNFSNSEFRPVLVYKVIGLNAIVIPITSSRTDYTFRVPVDISSKYKNINLKLGSLKSVNIDKKLNLTFIKIFNKGEHLKIEEKLIQDIIKNQLKKTLEL